MQNRSDSAFSGVLSLLSHSPAIRKAIVKVYSRRQTTTQYSPAIIYSQLPYIIHNLYAQALSVEEHAERIMLIEKFVELYKNKSYSDEIAGEYLNKYILNNLPYMDILEGGERDYVVSFLYWYVNMIDRLSQYITKQYAENRFINLYHDMLARNLGDTYLLPLNNVQAHILLSSIIVDLYYDVGIVYDNNLCYYIASENPNLNKKLNSCVVRDIGNEKKFLFKSPIVGTLAIQFDGNIESIDEMAVTKCLAPYLATSMFLSYIDMPEKTDDVYTYITEFPTWRHISANGKYLNASESITALALSLGLFIKQLNKNSVNYYDNRIIVVTDDYIYCIISNKSTYIPIEDIYDEIIHIIKNDNIESVIDNYFQNTSGDAELLSDVIADTMNNRDRYIEAINELNKRLSVENEAKNKYAFYYYIMMLVAESMKSNTFAGIIIS